MPSIGRLMLGLLIVLGFLFAAAWLLRRGGVITGNSGAIRIVAQTPVGTRERLVLVQVGEQQLLVGVTAQQIQLLHTLADPVVLPVSTGSNRFAEQLAAMMKGQRPS